MMNAIKNFRIVSEAAKGFKGLVSVVHQSTRSHALSTLDADCMQRKQVAAWHFVARTMNIETECNW